MNTIVNERAVAKKRGNKRWFVVFMLLVGGIINYLDRASLSIASIWFIKYWSEMTIQPTFDLHLTWKTQVETNPTRAMEVMKKLAVTTWAADGKSLKKLYTGQLSQHLEGDIASLGNCS